uniref:TPX2 C-terminal domain-containing protein n=1 Tax=Clastoptera arizonana TaxID=38151 RepID=A0A1B6DGN8_9HEMI
MSDKMLEVLLIAILMMANVKVSKPSPSTYDDKWREFLHLVKQRTTDLLKKEDDKDRLEKERKEQAEIDKVVKAKEEKIRLEREWVERLKAEKEWLERKKNESLYTTKRVRTVKPYNHIRPEHLNFPSRKPIRQSVVQFLKKHNKERFVENLKYRMEEEEKYTDMIDKDMQRFRSFNKRMSTPTPTVPHKGTRVRRFREPQKFTSPKPLFLSSTSTYEFMKEFDPGFFNRPTISPPPIIY